VEGFNKKVPRLIPIENYVFYQSLKNHFKKDVPWKYTKLYNWMMENLDLLCYGGYNTKKTYWPNLIISIPSPGN